MGPSLFRVPETLFHFTCEGHELLGAGYSSAVGEVYGGAGGKGAAGV